MDLNPAEGDLSKVHRARLEAGKRPLCQHPDKSKVTLKWHFGDRKEGII